ncbi:hypothetical protein JZ751_009323, partial [Albula glossodonta]
MPLPLIDTGMTAAERFITHWLPAARFQIPSEWESKLINPAKEYGGKVGKNPENDVYDSGKAQPQNLIKGNITGDLLKKSCTTILNNVPSNASDKY